MLSSKLKLSSLNPALWILALQLFIVTPTHAETVTIEMIALAGVYYVNDEARPTIELKPGNTYIFEGYSGWHPLSLSRTPDGRWQNGIHYEDGVVKTDERLIIEVTENTPDLYYLCDHHPNMGGAIKIVVTDK